ncbi:MAG: ROK family transcriptional regulator [Alicyclobacillus macrosporangiidus]|uniref:ROK family transcriptional regulator n=1 Tax=Alicyclobacillus macrosporangiidus TaxID=392015 RepID=UPI0026EC788B|nr:ROK family transcriptional regulator [Alicyclobacillus macrosporangiidus]MCL6599772.1 ROK family transcriptional regulator [Alicyclobacillus macrosporangiidus]
MEHTIDQQTMRKHHMALILNIIKEYGCITRAELARVTGMSPTSVSRIVRDLLDAEVVLETGLTEGGVGRRGTVLEVNSSHLLSIGIHVDKDLMEAALVDLNGKIVAREEHRSQTHADPTAAIRGITTLVHRMMQKFLPDMGRLLGVGVGIPGLVSWPEGTSLYSPQFGWKGIPIRSILESELGLTVLVDNHVKGMALGERFFGAAGNVEEFVCIYVGSGVGSAVFSKGELHRGALNSSGEVGHMTLDPAGPLCNCGRLGCLQAYICEPALEKEGGAPVPEILAACDRREPWAVRLLERAIEYLGMALSNVVCAYSPSLIVLSGPLIERRKELFIPKVREACKRFLWGPLDGSFELVTSHLGGDSGVIGAACIVFNELLSQSVDVKPRLVEMI